MKALSTVICDASSTEQDIETLLSNKSSAHSFTAIDKMNTEAIRRFVQLIQEIAESRKSETDNSRNFLKRCGSIFYCMKIMADENTVLQAYPEIFHNRLVRALHLLLGKVITIEPEEEEMPRILIQLLELLMQLIDFDRGLEVGLLLLFPRPLELIANHLSHPSFDHLLSSDLIHCIFETFLAFLPRWGISNLSDENKEKMLDKLCPQTNKFLLSILESLFQFGDISYQMALLMSAAYFSPKQECSRCLLNALMKLVQTRVTTTKLMQEFEKVFDIHSYEEKFAQISNFVHAANIAIAPTYRSFPAKCLAINGEVLIVPECSQPELGDAKLWVDVNSATYRVSSVLAGDGDEADKLEFLYLEPQLVKRVEYYASPDSPRCLTATLMLSQLPTLKSLMSIKALRGGTYELSISFTTPALASAFIAQLRGIFQHNIFYDTSEIGHSQTGYLDKEASADGAPRAVFATAFVSSQQQDDEEMAQQGIALRPLKTYGRKKSGDTLPTVVRKTAMPLNPFEPIPSSEATSSSNRKGSVSSATQKSLAEMFVPIRNGTKEKSPPPAPSMRQSQDLPEITSSIYDAADYTAKMARSFAFMPPISHLPLANAEENEAGQIIEEVPTEVVETSQELEQESVPMTDKKSPPKQGTKPKNRRTSEVSVVDETPEGSAFSNAESAAKQPEPTRPKTAEISLALSDARDSTLPTKASKKQIGNAESNAIAAPGTRKQPPRKAAMAAGERSKKSLFSNVSDDFSVATTNKKGRNSKGSKSLNEPEKLSQKKRVSTEKQRKSTAKQPVGAPKTGKRGRKQVQSLEEQMDAAFANYAEKEKSLPSLIIEDGKIDETGRLVEKIHVDVDDDNYERSIMAKITALKKQPSKETPPRTSSAVSKTPTSVERARKSFSLLQNSFTGVVPADELNQMIDLNSNDGNEVAEITSPSKRKDSSCNATTEPPFKKFALSSFALANNTKRSEKVVTPPSWSESYSGNDLSDTVHVAKLPDTVANITAQSDSDLYKLMEYIVSETCSQVSNVANESHRLSESIASTNEVIRNCAAKLHGLEKETENFSIAAKQIQHFNKDLIQLRQLLNEKSRNRERRRAVEEHLTRLSVELNDPHPAHLQEIVTALIELLR